jgi:DNA invertase Pin-like site-specific DNA recombinase
MTEQFEKKQIDCLIAWDIKRVARNPVNGGKIIWLLQNKKIKQIITHTKTYLPTDNVLSIYVDIGCANQDIIDIREGVSRGINSKILKGQPPYMARHGYINEVNGIKGDKKHLPDNEGNRFMLIKDSFRLIINQTHQPKEALNKLNENWGFRTRATENRTSKKLCESIYYQMLRNPYYAGYFYYRGELHKGSYEPMITWSEFEKLQVIIGNKKFSRAQKLEFDWTGILKCGHCGCSITADKSKSKFIKSENRIKNYEYYYCTGKRKGTSCNRLAIEKTELEKQLMNLKMEC